MTTRIRKTFADFCNGAKKNADFTRLRDNTKECLEASSIEVLPFIRVSWHWTEAFAWFVLIWVGVYLTYRDSAEAVASYIDEETVTDMKIRDSGKPLHINAKICVDYEPAVLAKSFASLRLSHLDDAFTEMLSTGDADANMSTSTIRLVYGLTILEHVRGSLENMGNIRLSANVRNENTSEIAYISALDTLQVFLNLRNISVKDAWRIAGTALCKMWQLKVQKYTNGLPLPIQNFCENVNVTWIGMIPFSVSVESTVCYHFHDNAQFSDMRDRSSLFYALYGVYDVSGPPTVVEDSQDFPITAYFDYSGDIVSSDLTYDWVELPAAGQCMSFSFGVSTECIMLNKRRQHCQENVETSFGSNQALECYARCTITQFRSICACFPDSWYALQNETLFDEAPFCSLVFPKIDNFRRLCAEKVYRSNESQDAMKACQKMCLGPCNFKFYSRLKGDRECKPVGNGTTTLVDFYPQNFIWPIMGEQLRLNAYQLVSSLGGVIGLWLGIGVMGVLHAFVSPLKIIIVFLVQKAMGAFRNNGSNGAGLKPV